MRTDIAAERAESTAPLAVLIVDDEPQLARELAEAIGDEGYPVEVVHSAADAMELLRSRTDIAVMITDIRMPNRNGLELTQDAIQFRDERDALEVILITGHASLEDANFAVRMGAFDFVRKPFRLQEIFDATSRAMARAAGRRSVVAGRNPQGRPESL
jgi:DNA-binding NtrC family response regulator